MGKNTQEEILFISLASVLVMTMLLGCGISGRHAKTGEWWYRDGTTRDETIVDLEYCSAKYHYLKEDMSTVEEDVAFCAQAAEDRKENRYRLYKSLEHITFLSIIIHPVAGYKDDYFTRCVRTKGYRAEPTNRDRNTCMAGKRYRWGIEAK